MKLLGGLCVAGLIICATFAEDIGKKREIPVEETREIRNYNQEWRSVDYFSPTSDTSGWIPHDEQIPKRRRIRKRKRRPPVFTEEETTLRKKTRPQRLDQIREPWEEMSEEITQKSINRRRLTPVYNEEETPTFERIRDPFTALQEAEEKQKTKVEETPDLKTILKQSGGLSLSEVLQQKNLSLSELLKGNRQAISVLAKEAETTTEAVTTEVPKYRRLPPSVSLKKDINRNFERVESLEGLSSHEVQEAQRKRLALLHGHNTEEITEKRIFVPYKSEDAATTPMIFSFKEKVRNKFVSQPPQETSEGPLKMTIDLENMKITTPLSEKLKRVTAKEEIMEILKNPVEREHLSRILRTRNMTIEELVQLRERGSSQIHLADIFHNKTREPEPIDEPFVGHVSSDNFPFFNRKSKKLPVSEVSSVAPTTQKTEEEEETTKSAYTITSFPTYKIETNKNLQLPVWRQLYPAFFPSTTEKIDYEELERLEEIENALAEAANGRLNVDVPQKSQNAYNDDEEFFKLPSGVKSAILASLAIIGLSLLVFLTILVIFKWSQRQKRLTYNGSFSGSKIRSPILEPDQRRATFKTFMSETLGKKKNYYKTHFHSMSDSIWDSGEKKSYMI